MDVAPTPTSISTLLDDERALAVVAVPLTLGAPGAIRVTRDSAAGGPFAAAERETLERLATAAEVAWRNIQFVASNDRARDLALVMEMSREIASTLDLDRVMRSVVNLAMKALPFDRGAIALYERGDCDIRAVAGAETVDPDDPELQDLAARSAWAAGIGESFYLSDRTEPASDAERTFLQVFGDDLAADGVASGLYIPLKDDEGVVGILVLESARTDFASASPAGAGDDPRESGDGRVAQRTAVQPGAARRCVRRPARAARKRSSRCLGSVASRWRSARWSRWVRSRSFAGRCAWMRSAPSFRPTTRAEIRPLTDGIIERVLVREGTTVERGMPIVQLRDAELRADYEAAAAAAARGGTVGGERGESRRCGGGASAAFARRRAADARRRCETSSCARRPSRSGIRCRVDAAPRGARRIVGRCREPRARARSHRYARAGVQHRSARRWPRQRW